MKAGEKVSSSFVMAPMFLGCKNTTNIVHIQILAGNKREFNYIFLHSQPKVIIIEVDNPVILQSAAHSGLLDYPPQQGLRFAHLLPVVCHSFGVLVTLSHQNRGCTMFHPCLWSCQPFWLAFIFTEQQNDCIQLYATSRAIEFSNSHQFNTDIYILHCMQKKILQFSNS